MNILDRYFEQIIARGIAREKAPVPRAGLLQLSDGDPPAEVVELADFYPASVRTLAKRTAQMHLVLAEARGSRFCAGTVYQTVSTQSLPVHANHLPAQFIAVAAAPEPPAGGHPSGGDSLGRPGIGHPGDLSALVGYPDHGPAHPRPRGLPPGTGALHRQRFRDHRFRRGAGPSGVGTSHQTLSSAGCGRHAQIFSLCRLHGASGLRITRVGAARKQGRPGFLGRLLVQVDGRHIP